MSRPIILVIGACLLYSVKQSLEKTFGDCELVMELRKQGFPEHQLIQWICLIEAESSKQTEVIGGPDSDGSFDYGLFQINDRYWCSSNDDRGKGCNVRCKDLLLDNITEASTCAQRIYSQQGFSAWVGWNNECRGRQLLSENFCYLPLIKP